ncbi:unnamed protein product [Trichogramma brassicae]|uniref:Uncharacterized protein n=1 Tax=Trichogramma brassicae TaxID=86971 RepID=A0A6H5IRD6_9HYME|nr:unnamed protein product [Trichogramma brassicae]
MRVVLKKRSPPGHQTCRHGWCSGTQCQRWFLPRGAASSAAGLRAVDAGPRCQRRRWCWLDGRRQRWRECRRQRPGRRRQRLRSRRGRRSQRSPGPGTVRRGCLRGRRAHQEESKHDGMCAGAQQRARGRDRRQTRSVTSTLYHHTL